MFQKLLFLQYNLDNFHLFFLNHMEIICLQTILPANGAKGRLKFQFQSYKIRLSNSSHALLCVSFIIPNNLTRHQRGLASAV